MGDLLYVQQDGKIIVKSQHPDFTDGRTQLAAFSTLAERQDPIFVYQITATTLWQAAATGLTPRNILNFLRHSASQPIPFAVQERIVDEMAKWGALRLTSVRTGTVQLSFQARWHDSVWNVPLVRQLALEEFENRIVFPAEAQGPVKQILAQAGLPVTDLVGYEAAPKVSIQLRDSTTLRGYQSAAVQSFFADSMNQSGVILMPCGSGKTLVGLAILSQLGFHTLIVTPSDTAARQWIEECIRHTTIASSAIGMYQPGKTFFPVTVTTYQRIAGKTQKGVHRHLQALTSHPWGLVIYDEVHVLPAPLFRLAADLQSSRRLGLTATLVREDAAETDVYSLIGPKCFDVDWKQLEQDGYLAQVNCIELQVPLPADEQETYRAAAPRVRHKVAAQNSYKVEFVGELLRRHSADHVLVIGHYLESLAIIAKRYQVPLITGQTPLEERNRLYQQFREGRIRCLVLSRVANMAIDLPRATVGIQVSGLYASRQEEAQRLGRLLRPKHRQAYFYSLVSADTVEVETARRRQRFLVEHGYSYETRTIDTERVKEF